MDAYITKKQLICYNTTMAEHQESNVHIHTMYGMHDTPIAPQEIPTNTDGVILENTFHEWDTEEKIKDLLSTFQKSDPQYKLLLCELAARKMSVVLLDPTFSRSSITKEDVATRYQAVIGVVLLAIAGCMNRILGHGKQEIAEAKEVNDPTSTVIKRRDFLRRTMQGVLAGGGLYLAQPEITQGITHVAHRTGMLEGAAAANNDICHTMHPRMQQLTVKIRNLIIAYKAAWFAHKKKGDDFALVMGPDHATTLDNELTGTMDELLREIRKPEIMRSIQSNLIIPSSLYSIAECRHDGNEWKMTQMHEIPELKDLF